jgi:hypothetical protein
MCATIHDGAVSDRTIPADTELSFIEKCIKIHLLCDDYTKQTQGIVSD